MTDDEIKNMTYEDKEARLDEILTRLDNSETPMDELASEAKEASKLIASMYETLKSARTEITEVFAEMEKTKQAMAGTQRAEPEPEEDDDFAQPAVRPPAPAPPRPPPAPPRQPRS